MDGNKKITGIIFAGIVALNIIACKVQLPGYVGLYANNLISVTDTADSGVMSLNVEDSVMAQVVDTTVVTEAGLPVSLQPVEEIINTSSDSVYQYEVENLLKTISDSIQLLKYQMNEIQKQLTEIPPTSFTEENSREIQPLNSQLTNNQSQQQLRAKDEQIQTSQNRMNSMQNAAGSASQQAPVTMVVPLQPKGSQQNNQLTQQIFQAQNDTIQFLKSQIQMLQLQPQKTDTVYIESEDNEQQSVKEIVAESKTTDLQLLQDTISLLKTLVLSLEEQIVQGMNTALLVNQKEKDTSYTTKTDTTLLVAYYKAGEIKPLEEVNIFQQIKELYRIKNVIKITLSGYTDSSGSERINKEITNRRLNYLSEMIMPWVAMEKVFFQNFGETFASDIVVDDERRIEMRIYTK